MPAPCLKKDVEIKIVQIKHKIPIWNCISGGLGDWHSSCIFTTIPLLGIQTSVQKETTDYNGEKA